MRYNRTLLAVLAAGLVLSPRTAAVSYASSVEIQEAKKKVSSLEAEKKKAEETLKKLEGLKSDTAAYIKRMDQELNALESELTRLEQQIQAKDAEIAQAKEDLEAARQEEESQYASMKLRIQYMYENGRTSAAESMIHSGSISELLNRAEYSSRIAEYDRRMLNEYRETKEEVNRKEQKLEEEHAGLLELQESVKAKRSSVETLLRSKETELAGYNSKIASAQGEIDRYNADIKAQEDQMRKIEAEMKRREEEARKKAEAQGKQYTVANLGNISFKWPCPGSSRITSRFGDRESPTEGASTNHKGIDIGASSGTAIIAAAAGEVVISTYSYSAGNYIMIDHGGGVSTVYMHCSQLLASKGQKVKQGQTIAKVGSTGYSTGPHLHFGIRSGGSYVNPLSYVSP